MHAAFFKIPDWQVLLHFIQVQIERPFVGTDLRTWEWLCLCVCLAAVWLVPGGLLRWSRFWFHNYAQHRRLAILTCALLPVIVRVALLPAFPVHPPSIHDEFSWLLLGDTFRSGRLTNPPHLLWQHFETIHEIQQPTYTSMYPPGFGAMVALGYLVDDPWAGVLAAVALMCGAACWALQGWLPPAWAFGGALLMAARIGVASCWVSGFVGGGPTPFMAGALLLGSIPRFLRKPGTGLATVQGFAMVLLVNTRPFEGTVFSACCGAYVLWRLRATRTAIKWQTVAPAAFVLFAGGVFTLYYNWRVTGDPLKLPYVANREAYGWPENLAILPPRKVVYRHKILKDMHEQELMFRQWYSTFGRMLASWCARYAEMWEFFIGPALTLPLLFVPFLFRKHKFRPLFWILAVMLVLNTLQLMAYPEHVAAEAIIFYVLIGAGLRYAYVRTHRLGIRPERVMLAVFLCVCCGAWMLLSYDRLHPMHGIFWEWPHQRYGEARAAMIAKLEQMPGKHVMVVRYGPSHSPHEQWVYNSADIDGSKIVWANSMGAADDRVLLSYFRDRQAWLVEPDRDGAGFLPLTPKTYGGDKPCPTSFQLTGLRAGEPRAGQGAGSLPNRLKMSDPSAERQLTAGFHELERNAWRWTARRFSVVFVSPAGSHQTGATLRLQLLIPETQIQRLGPMTLSAEAGDAQLDPETFTKGGAFAYVQHIPASAFQHAVLPIVFTFDKAAAPGQVDARELSAVVTEVALEPGR